MKLKLIAYGIVGAFALNTANAGDSKGVMEAGPVAAAEPFGATLSAGYMTDYVFYGLELGKNAVWTGLDYTIEGLPLPVDVGVWYVNPTNGVLDDELDLYASVAGPSFAGFDTSLTFTAFLYPELSSGETYELALGVSRSLGIVDMNASAHYDFELDAWYFETGVSKGIGITDALEVVVSTGISYQIDYYAAGGEFNHVYVMAALPIALTDTATLEPYVAGLFALDAIDGIQDDIIHGGVSLSVSF